MKSNLAYINEVIDRETDRRFANAPASLTEADKKSAQKSGIKVVAGFEIHDEAAEKKAIDEIIAKRRAVIEAFRKDRAYAASSLSALGIQPLAIIPRSAWYAICDQAGLFRLSPDPRGRVGIAPGAFADYMVEVSIPKVGMLGTRYEARSFTVREAAEEDIEAYAKEHWADFLKQMFDGLVAPIAQSGPFIETATLVLPQPPQDVQDILLKAAGADAMPLKVAAVAEAIAFKETPAQILKKQVAKREEEARRQERIDADPIVYWEHGSAAAIIAQFGDFPIEQEVVDSVAASDKAISSKVTETLVLEPRDIQQVYLEDMRRQQFIQLQGLAGMQSSRSALGALGWR